MRSLGLSEDPWALLRIGPFPDEHCHILFGRISPQQEALLNNPIVCQGAAYELPNTRKNTAVPTTQGQSEATIKPPAKVDIENSDFGDF